ncbi:MAG: laglidadg endonuclease [Brevundimonas sp.]|nr:laglidadg endonuclease [Brevundimonas sp.]
MDREQYYLDWAFKSYGLLVLNYLRETSSSLGFKHSEETKKIISELVKGRKHSEETKEKLSTMHKGELNPFNGKSHKPETIAQMKACKIGEKNPMYNKEKSPEFI